MRAVAWFAAFVLAAPVSGQVQILADRTPSPGAPATNHPLHLSIKLAPSTSPESFLDLGPSGMLSSKETGQFFAEAIRSQPVAKADDRGGQSVELIAHRTAIVELRLRKFRTAKGGSKLTVAMDIATEAPRQKLDLRVGLWGSDRELWAWQERVELGVSPMDVFFVGVLALLGDAKGKTVEISFPISDDIKQALQADPQLEIHLTLED
jgi:hypothetical protein